MFLFKLTSHHRLGTLLLQYCKIGQTIRPVSILEGDPSLRLTELGLSHSVSRLAVGELVATTAMCCQDQLQKVAADICKCFQLMRRDWETHSKRYHNLYVRELLLRYWRYG